MCMHLFKQRISISKVWNWWEKTSINPKTGCFFFRSPWVWLYIYIYMWFSLKKGFSLQNEVVSSIPWYSHAINYKLTTPHLFSILFPDLPEFWVFLTHLMDDFHIVALFALTRSRMHRETLAVLMKVVNNYFDTRSTKIGYIVAHKCIVKVIWCYCICFQPNALRTMKIGIFNQLFLTGRIFQKQVKVVTNFGLPMLGSRTLCCPCALPEINKALASTGRLLQVINGGQFNPKYATTKLEEIIH